MSQENAKPHCHVFFLSLTVVRMRGVLRTTLLARNIARFTIFTDADMVGGHKINKIVIRKNYISKYQKSIIGGHVSQLIN